MDEKYTVLKDTREQKGWTFAASKMCAGMTIATLSTGDYTVRGLENVLVVERKSSTGEFAANILEARFERELIRMEKFAYAFVVCEFTMDQIMRFPEESGIPAYKWKYIKVTSHFMLKRFLELQMMYKCKFILAGTKGKEVASSIFKRAYEQHYNQDSNKKG